MARLLGGAGLHHGTGTMPAVPFPNGPVHNLNTSASAASTPPLQPKTRAVGMTLSDPHYVSINGTPATTASWKVSAGFFLLPLPKRVTGDGMAVSILPEGGGAASGDGIQSLAEWS